MVIKLNKIDEIRTFNTIANGIKGDVLIKQGRYIIDGKSLMGIFSLNFSEGFVVEIENKDEEAKFVEMINEAGVKIDIE